MHASMKIVLTMCLLYIRNAIAAPKYSLKKKMKTKNVMLKKKIERMKKNKKELVLKSKNLSWKIKVKKVLYRLRSHSILKRK